MKTSFQIIYANGTVAQREIDWPDNPEYSQIKALVEPFIDGGPLEHVAVLHDFRRADMFVNALGHVMSDPLPYNEYATTIYRRATLNREPLTNPDDLPWIAGNAVLFDRIVWT